MAKRFDHDKADAIAYYAIHSLLEYAEQHGQPIVSVPKPVIRDALDQMNLQERHFEELASRAAEHGIGLFKRDGVAFVFRMEGESVMDATKVFPTVARAYVGLSGDMREALYRKPRKLINDMSRMLGRIT